MRRLYDDGHSIPTPHTKLRVNCYLSAWVPCRNSGNKEFNWIETLQRRTSGQQSMTLSLRKELVDCDEDKKIHVLDQPSLSRFQKGSEGWTCTLLFIACASWKTLQSHGRNWRAHRRLNKSHVLPFVWWNWSCSDPNKSLRTCKCWKCNSALTDVVELHKKRLLSWCMCDILKMCFIGGGWSKVLSHCCATLPSSYR